MVLWCMPVLLAIFVESPLLKGALTLAKGWQNQQMKTGTSNLVKMIKATATRPMVSSCDVNKGAVPAVASTTLSQLSSASSSSTTQMSRSVKLSHAHLETGEPSSEAMDPKVTRLESQVMRADI